MLTTMTILGMLMMNAPISKQEPKLASLIHPTQVNAAKLRAVQENMMLAKDIATAMKTHRKNNWGQAQYFDNYARLFVESGRRWGVDPIIVACIAYVESRYMKNPPAFYRKKCINKMIGCNRPGPCYPRWEWTCTNVRVNVAEAGMMQVLYNDISTREGYHKCTGKQLVGTQEVKQRSLQPPRIAICVGAYELAKWKQWAMHGGYGRIRCVKRNGMCHGRMTPKYHRNVAFFQKYPRLKRHFWVAWYNWGSNKRKGNRYPRQVLWCYRNYKQKIIKLRRNRKQTTDRRTGR